MASRDYLRLVERHFPLAFARCCACQQERPAGSNASSEAPCYSLTDLWSPCFLSHVKRHSQLASFLVEQLGIFGIFGNEMDKVPPSVLDADPRLSWVVNNAYKWKGARRYIFT